ncbi:hypothetical protein PAXINDRAFT_171793 [Paxillus involutus ATCC 200175]|jgi:hypothetical protein|uniref:Uncharacterized protein n=1 Tax=Paxillus involutus ATCC 200175 TaxID=664439 RepID=A0A0C9TVJ2_PAXIN|nr:hypothetical protein PAXINDRAFT_171793 [Paxillus involutus ATCC 200175]
MDYGITTIPEYSSCTGDRRRPYNIAGRLLILEDVHGIAGLVQSLDHRVLSSASSPSNHYSQRLSRLSVVPENRQSESVK